MTEQSQEESGLYHILAFGFDDPNRGEEVLNDVWKARTMDKYHVLAHAAVSHEADGKVHFHEPGQAGAGAVLGGASLGMIGLLAGPAGFLAMAAAGAVMGGVAGHLLEQAIPKKDLEEIAEALPPGSSAFMVLADDVDAEAIKEEMAAFSPRKAVSLSMGSDLSEQIRAATDS